jgi:hypothetical protein
MKTYPDVERILLLNGTAAALLNHPRDADYAIRADGLNRHKKEILRDRDKYAAAVAWMRGEFGKELVELGQQLQIPIAEHGSDLCWIALMNGRSIDWLNREFENARPTFREEFRNWIAIAADGALPIQDWCAPLWLARFPEPLDYRGSVAAALPRRLRSRGTNAVLDAAGSRLDRELERAERTALDRAHIEFATQPRTADEKPSNIEETDGKNKWPESLRRGERAHKIIDEARRIRRMFIDSGRTVAEIEDENPGYAIWSVAKNLPADDQETFRHPNRWDSRVVGYQNLFH